jgi:5'-nucleotidase (lipoprotein e(P4) family)
MKKNQFGLLFLLLAVLVAGCQKRELPQNDLLNANLWMQTSAEYKIIVHQTYQQAMAKLEPALADPNWHAVLENPGNDIALPPAVILDVDETVLDNSPLEARLIQNGQSYNSEAWNQWVNEAAAPALPGAVEFTRKAADLGIRVVYLTNRSADHEEVTRQNLIKQGFPLPDDADAVLCKGEHENWGSDKTSRRAYVASSFRVLLLLGDDLNDFVYARTEPAARVALFEKYKSNFGQTWFQLPNPAYGSWEGALYGFDHKLPDDEKRAKKRSALRTE